MERCRALWRFWRLIEALNWSCVLSSWGCASSMNDRLPNGLHRKINLALHDLYQSRAAGPRFRIVHRRPHSGSIYCVTGEQVLAAYLTFSNRSIWLKLPLSQLLLFDNLSKHL